MAINTGEKLKFVRKKLGFTQQQMAEKLNIKQSQYSLMERDMADIQMDKVGKLVDLGVSPVWFISQNDDIIYNQKIAFDLNYVEHSNIEVEDSAFKMTKGSDITDIIKKDHEIKLLKDTLQEKDEKIDNLNKYIGKLESLLEQNHIDINGIYDSIKKGVG